VLAPIDAGTYLAATLFVWFVCTDLRPTPDPDVPADVASKLSADVASWVAAVCERSDVPIDPDAWRAATGIEPTEVHPCDA
jgi:hypothetical protein